MKKTAKMGLRGVREWYLPRRFMVITDPAGQLKSTEPGALITLAGKKYLVHKTGELRRV